MNIFFKITTKKKEHVYGKYPVECYLNNALYFLLDDQDVNIAAVKEICMALEKANGEFYQTTKDKIQSKIRSGKCQSLSKYL